MWIPKVFAGVLILAFFNVAVDAGVVRWKGPGGARLSKQVKSLKELRFEGVVRQRLDFSCGSAALATLLKYYYGREVSEDEIVEDIIQHGDLERIAEKGFSMLDLKLYAERLGFKAEGYKVKAEHLPKVKIPTIVLLNIREYHHFVVLKGVRGGKAYIADPALGNTVMDFSDFVKAWNGILLAVFGERPHPAPAFASEGGIEAPKETIMRLQDLGPRAPFLSDTFEIKR